MPGMQEGIEFTVRSITDNGSLLTMLLQQEIRTEPIDQAEMLRQRIESIRELDDDTKEVMKKIIPAIIPFQQVQHVTYSPIQMSITITRPVYERIGSPKVGDTLIVTIHRA
ncbi:MAG: hypothetical protein RMJ59_07740 [Candidatus Nitrosocaldus sp.]|nr:hypothetical protein [Candidatus Nitrosocaldus sp.]MCS7141659.1 hypothetical protein [Candidatus Nitrosocaldus sp.]MDW8000678.1 hypothetical protein [Candidatus Nitrosocaldus sp.]MDW8276251.1 hypothetical protein [Candidatus Nitrosocaldus sp.]